MNSYPKKLLVPDIFTIVQSYMFAIIAGLVGVFCNSKMQSLAANLCRTLPTSIQKNLGRLHAG
jgi:hypothetical protein